MDSSFKKLKKNRSSTAENPNRSNKAIVKRRPQTMAELFASTGSAIGTLMFIWTFIRPYFPQELRRLLQKYTHKLVNYFNPYVRISFYEFIGDRLNRSKAYSAVEAYLTNKLPDDARRLKGEVGARKNDFILSMEEYETVTDEFDGIEVWWILNRIESTRRSSSSHTDPERRFYRLTFHKRHKNLVTESYLKHVLMEGKEIRASRRQRKLYTNGTGNKWPSYRQTTLWSDVFFQHPATFDSIAMDPEKKQEIIEDLMTFSQSKDFYAKIGKAWKRGYLLYGPPGTGKSTMIAAMANLLNYDVYDLELTAVKDNTELRKLLIETTSRSIIVIEDIDCSIDLTGKRKKKEPNPKNEEREKHYRKEDEDESSSKITLSGLLNFIDGIWSACGDERLIVFTTNHVDKLDPALIRSGRMDKHIELSYCKFEGFKVFAQNYLNLETHQLFDQIQELFKDAKITPADVAENLMPKYREDTAENSLFRLIRTLEELKNAAAIKETEEENAENSNRSSSETVEYEPQN